MIAVFVVILGIAKNCGQMQLMQQQLRCSHRIPKDSDIMATIAVANHFLKPSCESHIYLSFSFPF